MTKQLRCIHRHTIDEHPKCFERGLVKGSWDSDRQFEKETGQPWYRYPDYRIGYLDIESDGFDADFSTMLTWCIKEKEGEITYGVIDKEHLFSGKSDYYLVESLLKEMKRYKILVGYNSDWFDFPYIRAKSLHYGLEFPGYGELYVWDLYYTVKSKLRISRKSLANACDYLGIPGKTQVDKNVWRQAKYGDKKALAEVLDHNMGDVVATETLHNKLSFTRKWLRKSI